MSWIAIIELIFAIVGPLVEKLIDQWLLQAAEKIANPGDSGRGEEFEVGRLFDTAIDEASGHIVARITLRIVKRIAVPRSRALFAGSTGEPLTSAEMLSLGI